jgi:hypothetical protein
MSSIGTPEPGTGTAPGDTRGVALPAGTGRSVRRVAAVGQTVVVLTLAALLLEAAGWVIAGPGTFRTGGSWGATAALVLCVIALAAVKGTSALPDAESAYRSAWETGLGGAYRKWWRALLVACMLPAYLAFLFGMGSAALEEPGDAQRIAASGARIVGSPVLSVEELGKTGPGRHDDYRALYDLRLSEKNAVASGRGDHVVRVEVLSDEYLNKGDRVYVAFAPDDPGLDPIADESRHQVEQMLSGRSFDFRVWVGVMTAWAVGTVALVVWTLRKGSGTYPSRRTKHGREGARTLRGRVEGYVRHVLDPVKHEALFGLEISTAAGPVPMELNGCSAEWAGAVLGGQRGLLEWPADLPAEHAQGPLALTPADFVTDDGRRLQGRVPTRLLQDLSAAGEDLTKPVPQRTQRGAGVVDLGAVWPLTIRWGALLLCLLAVALPIPLFLVPHMGGWGLALVIADGAAVICATALDFFTSVRKDFRSGTVD